ncbi:MAG: GAF domain-containing protein [Deltaproteobacteria bacterium]|nr:GAF domain-containing protein [Deltaproteobacteria bacterium]
MLKKIFHGFRTRVFWLTSLMVVILSVFFTLIVIYQQGKLLKQDLVAKGLLASKNIAHDIKLGVFTENQSLLDNIVQRTANWEKDMVYVRVYNNLHERPIYENIKGTGDIPLPLISDDIKKQAMDGAFYRKTAFNNNNTEVYEFWAPVMVSKEFKAEDVVIDTGIAEAAPSAAPADKTIGIVQIGFSLESINARINGIVRTSVSLTLFFFPVCFILTYMIAKRITGPLLKLEKAVQTIEKGGEFKRIDIDSKDEIGHLASSFNSMVDSLKKKDEEIIRHIRELSALNTVASAVNQSLDLKETLMDGLKEILKLTNMEAGWIFLVSEDGSALKVAAHAGVEDSFIQKVDSLKPGEGFAGKVILSGELIIEEDISGDPRVSRGAVFEQGFRAFASIPLRSKTRILGAINITSRLTHPFTTNEVELLYSMGNQMGTGIENSQLYEQLKKQLEEIERTQDQLIRSARLASLGELSANVAHEINNPLTGVLTHASMMLDETTEQDPDHKRLKIIYDETLRIRHIVRNLLDFARQVEPRRDNVSIVDVIKDTLDLIVHLAKIGNIEIVEEYIYERPVVSVDVAQTKQVLLNMFNNAIHAMPDGGALKIRTTKKQEGWVNIHIEDTGHGIPQDIMHRIFDPFFTTKPQPKGTGLGLSISHGIIERHGGKIEVESAIGKGSMFTIMLPVAV